MRPAVSTGCSPDTHFHGGAASAWWAISTEFYRGNKPAATFKLRNFEVRAGFEWIDCHDKLPVGTQTICARGTDGSQLVVILNFTPVPRENYRIGLPQAGSYREILNSDSKFYAGSNLGNDGQIQAEQLPWMNQPHSTVLRLPPLGAIVLKPEG